MMIPTTIRGICLLSGLLSGLVFAQSFNPVVEFEETVYAYEPPNNGAGPMWNYGGSNIVRLGADVYVSGSETLVGVPPLNNTQCVLWRRNSKGWQRVDRVESGPTREPCPLGVFPKSAKVMLSGNPSDKALGYPGGSTAKPEFLVYGAVEASLEQWRPKWRQEVRPEHFTEHSYRSVAIDPGVEEMLLMQNVENSHSEWSFRDRRGRWFANGRLDWPWGGEYTSPKPVRVCYASVMLKNRSVHFLGVSDIVEPNDAWRKFKREKKGEQFSYVFRRLFYNWTPDITSTPFEGWVEVASRESTAGGMRPADLWVAPDGAVHILWNETYLDIRLRDEFFPSQKQRREMNYAIIRNGGVVHRKTLMATTENEGLVGSLPRLHVTPRGRMLVFYHVGGKTPEGRDVSENRMIEIRKDGSVSEPVILGLEAPLTNFMTATPRNGSLPSPVLDLLGSAVARPNTVRYVRIRVE